MSASSAGDYRVALYHYNPVPEYADAVMRYARQMSRDPRTFYAYYSWQVFVLTKHGEVRLTGPACDSRTRSSLYRRCRRS